MSGEEVAVKVQRPYVLETVTVDLYILRQLGLLMRQFPNITQVPQPACLGLRGCQNAPLGAGPVLLGSKRSVQTPLGIASPTLLHLDLMCAHHRLHYFLNLPPTASRCGEPAG